MNVKKVRFGEEVVEETIDFDEFVFVVVSVRQGRRGKTQKMLAFFEDKFTTRRHPLHKMRVQRQLRNFTLEGDQDLEIGDYVHVKISPSEVIRLAQVIESL